MSLSTAPGAYLHGELGSAELLGGDPQGLGAGLHLLATHTPRVLTQSRIQLPYRTELEALEPQSNKPVQPNQKCAHSVAYSTLLQDRA